MVSCVILKWANLCRVYYCRWVGGLTFLFCVCVFCVINSCYEWLLVFGLDFRRI